MNSARCIPLSLFLCPAARRAAGEPARGTAQSSLDPPRYPASGSAKGSTDMASISSTVTPAHTATAPRVAQAQELNRPHPPRKPLAFTSPQTGKCGPWQAVATGLGGKRDGGWSRTRSEEYPGTVIRFGTRHGTWSTSCGRHGSQLPPCSTSKTTGRPADSAAATASGGK